MSEATLAEALRESGIMLSPPREYRPDDNKWGVYVGSHGGEGTTLLKAMRACLMCCGLGKWWRIDYGHGELLHVVFDRVAREHLGRGVYAEKGPMRLTCSGPRLTSNGPETASSPT
jgi:hypothetical protein